MHHRPPSAVAVAIAAGDELLLAALSDADTAALCGPTIRRATLVADLDPSPVEIAHEARRLGIKAADFDRLADCACSSSPAQALADWIATETRPHMRKALAAALLNVIGEEATR